MESVVRKAANDLHDAIVAAQDAGYRVEFPGSVAGLKSIAISETAAVKKLPPVPKVFGKRKD